MSPIDDIEIPKPEPSEAITTECEELESHHSGDVREIIKTVVRNDKRHGVCKNKMKSAIKYIESIVDD